MKFLRALAIILTQSPLLLFVAGQRDLLFGSNQTDAGFSSLLALFFLVPLLNLTWLVAEARRSIRLGKYRVSAMLLLMPCVALLFLLESIAIDLYLLSHLRM